MLKKAKEKEKKPKPKLYTFNKIKSKLIIELNTNEKLKPFFKKTIG